MTKASSYATWEEAVLWLKAQPEQAELVRACFFDDPLIEAAQRYHQCAEWRAVRSLIGPARGRALDVGAGRGISAFALAADGWETIALEPDSSAEIGAAAIRRLSAESGLPMSVVESWGESLPFDSDSFDLVHCRQVLHHARDLELLCREIARVLKKGGMMIGTREHVLSRKEDLPEFLRNHPLHRLYGGENAYPLAEYLRVITSAGLRLRFVLNPFESEINTFPETIFGIKQRLARKLRFPFPKLIPDAVVKWRGTKLHIPGRLYTFVAIK